MIVTRQRRRTICIAALAVVVVIGHTAITRGAIVPGSTVACTLRIANPPAVARRLIITAPAHRVGVEVISGTHFTSVSSIALVTHALAPGGTEAGIVAGEVRAAKAAGGEIIVINSALGAVGSDVRRAAHTIAALVAGAQARARGAGQAEFARRAIEVRCTPFTAFSFESDCTNALPRRIARTSSAAGGLWIAEGIAGRVVVIIGYTPTAIRTRDIWAGAAAGSRVGANALSVAGSQRVARLTVRVASITRRALITVRADIALATAARPVRFAIAVGMAGDRRQTVSAIPCRGIDQEGVVVGVALIATVARKTGLAVALSVGVAQSAAAARVGGPAGTLSLAAGGGAEEAAHAAQTLLPWRSVD